MSGNAMMAAIGNIDDRYVMEFTDVTAIKKPVPPTVKLFLPLAGCLCAACLALALLITHQGKPPAGGPQIIAPIGSTTPTVPNNTTAPTTAVPPTTMGTTAGGTVIWCENTFGDLSDDRYEGVAEKGKIMFAKSLEEAMKKSANRNDIFAVYVEVMPGVPMDYVYDTFVKPLNVQEDYMKHGIIFLTADQIAAAECPSDYWLVFHLAVDPNRALPERNYVITPEYLDKVTRETMEVFVWFKSPPDLNKENVKAELAKIRDAIYADYGITEDMLTTNSIRLPRFIARLDVATIAKLLEDPRIGVVIDWEYRN